MALHFVNMSMSKDWQLNRWESLAKLPTRAELADVITTKIEQTSCLLPLASILNASGWGSGGKDVEVPVMSGLCPPVSHIASAVDVNVTNYIVARPALVAAQRYADVSTAFYSTVHDALKAGAQGAVLDKYLRRADCTLRKAMGQVESLPLPCIEACADGQVADGVYCKPCHLGSTTKELTANANIRGGKVWLQTSSPHGLHNSDLVRITGRSPLGYLSDENFLVVVQSATTVTLLEHDGHAVDASVLSKGAVEIVSGLRPLLRCMPCSPGNFADGTTPGCRMCGAGSYSSEQGLSECLFCPLGAYTSALGSTACEVCAAPLTTAARGGRSSDECVCPEGMYWTAASSLCLTCPEGMQCNVGSREGALTGSGGIVAPLVQPGYMVPTTSPLTPYKCRFRAWCPGGPPGTCLEGRESLSVGCGGCEDLNGRCIGKSDARKIKSLLKFDQIWHLDGIC